MDKFSNGFVQLDQTSYVNLLINLIKVIFFSMQRVHVGLPAAGTFLDRSAGPINQGIFQNGSLLPLKAFVGYLK
jgi:hypothetical protein